MLYIIEKKIIRYRMCNRIEKYLMRYDRPRKTSMLSAYITNANAVALVAPIKREM